MALEPLATLTGHLDRVWHVAWDPTGSFLASCGGDRSIRIWAMPQDLSSSPSPSNQEGDTTNKPKSEWRLLATLEDGQTRTVRCCEWSPCGKFLAAVSFDATCVIWELTRKNQVTGEMEWELAASVEGHEHEAKSVAWNRGGTLLATCSRDKSVWIWESLKDNDFECLSVLHGHDQDVKFVKFHPREDKLFSASYDDNIKVWEEGDDDWYCVATLKGHTSTVWGLAVGNRDDGLVSCGDDATLIIWKHNGTCLSICLSIDLPNRDDGLLSCGDDATLIIWKQTDGKHWRSVCKVSGYHTCTIYSVDWSRETGAIASGSADDSIRIFVENEASQSSSGWSMDQPSYICEAHVAGAHTSDVNCVRWNPKRPFLLASAGDDQVVRVWRYRPVA